MTNIESISEMLTKAGLSIKSLDLNFNKIVGIGESISKFINPLIGIGASINSSIINLGLSSSFFNHLIDINDLFGGLSYDEFQKFIEDFGWLELVSLSYGVSLNKTYKESGNNGVWTKLIQDFSNNEFLESLKNECSNIQILSNRLKILNRAFYHHITKDFVSSVPLLLSQIEGLLWDMGIKEKIIENKTNSINLIDEKGNFILNKKGKPLECSVEQLTSKLFGGNSELKKHISKKVYSEHLRHPILHGRKTNYDNEILSTMLILMLDMIIENIKERGAIYT